MGKNKRNFMITHGKDIDGFGCAALLKHADPNATVDLCQEANQLNDMLKQYIAEGKFNNFDTVYITDLCPNPEMMQVINNDPILRKKIQIVDHHYSALKDGSGEYDFAEINVEDKDADGNITKKHSAMGLFYDKLCKEKMIKPKAAMQEATELTEAQDTFEWKKLGKQKADDLARLFSQVGGEKYLEILEQKFRGKKFEFTQEEAALIKAHKEQETERFYGYLDKMQEIDINGIKTGAFIITDEKFADDRTNFPSWYEDMMRQAKENGEKEFDGSGIQVMVAATAVIDPNAPNSEIKLKPKGSARTIGDTQDGKNINDGKAGELVKFLTISEEYPKGGDPDLGGGNKNAGGAILPQYLMQQIIEEQQRQSGQAAQQTSGVQTPDMQNQDPELGLN